MSVPAVLLQESQIDAAAQAMGRAFFDDPLQKYFLPDEQQRRDLGPPFFAAMIRDGLRFGQVYTTGASDGAAVWFTAEGREMDDERFVASGLADAAAAVGDEAFGRFAGVMEFLEPFHKRDAPSAHWYLAVIGVDPAMQGRGIGKSLIEPIVKKADGAGLPCYLETAQPKNVPFYQHLGFDVIVDTIDPVSGLQLWTFLRPPNA
jgi:GNAT superfamily N-acetyltransferase